MTSFFPDLNVWLALSFTKHSHSIDAWRWLNKLSLSNNVAENSMRPVALGRKNWLHVGSAWSGPKIAAILSVVESCRRLRVPVKEYLLAVLPGMSGRKHSEAAKFTPAHWMPSRV